MLQRIQHGSLYVYCIVIMSVYLQVLAKVSIPHFLDILWCVIDIVNKRHYLEYFGVLRFGMDAVVSPWLIFYGEIVVYVALLEFVNGLLSHCSDGRICEIDATYHEP